MVLFFAVIKACFRFDGRLANGLPIPANYSLGVVRTADMATCIEDSLGKTATSCFAEDTALAAKDKCQAVFVFLEYSKDITGCVRSGATGTTKIGSGCSGIIMGVPGHLCVHDSANGNSCNIPPQQKSNTALVFSWNDGGWGGTWKASCVTNR